MNDINIILGKNDVSLEGFVCVCVCVYECVCVSEWVSEWVFSIHVGSFPVTYFSVSYADTLKSLVKVQHGL